MLYNTGCLVCYFSLLLGISVAQASGPYFASNYTTTWKSASTKHNFAAPDISYNENNLTVNFNLELGNKDVWIGCFRALTAFEYIGCMREESVNGSRIHKSDRNAPGLCFSACGKPYLVGLRLKMCYCIENLHTESHRFPNCNDTCPGENDFLCGGDGHISLYKVNYEVPLSKQTFATDDKNCLLLNKYPASKTRIWKECQANLKTMCSFENGTILTAKNYRSWKNAAKRCFELNGYATRYENTTFNFGKLPTGQSWTCVIRSNVIYKYSEMDLNIFGDIGCGYIEQSQTLSKNVVFTNQCDHQRNSLLCRTETSSTVATSSIIISSVSGTTTETSSTVATSSIIISSVSGTTTETSSTAATSSIYTSSVSDTTTGSDVSVVAGTVVSILVVIAVVVAFIVLKRRKKLPFVCKDTVLSKKVRNQQSKPTIDQMSHENHDYDHASFENSNTFNTNSDNNYAHTYFVLEPHVNESNTDTITYDTSDNSKKTTIEQDNVYNTMDLHNNETYDHAHTKVRNGVPKVDDTYDTTEKAAMKLKGTRGKDAGAFGETDEDVYNHITSKPVKNVQTENDYGIINKLENEYGDVVTHNKNNNHDEGDTYSHIHNKS